MGQKLSASIFQALGAMRAMIDDSMRCQIYHTRGGTTPGGGGTTQGGGLWDVYPKGCHIVGQKDSHRASRQLQGALQQCCFYSYKLTSPQCKAELVAAATPRRPSEKAHKNRRRQ